MNILFEKIKNAKHLIGEYHEPELTQEENKLIKSSHVNEETVIGQDYVDDNSDYEIERPDLGESINIPDPESPNDIDADCEEMFHEEEENCENPFTVTLSRPIGSVKYPNDNCSVTTEQKEESMDKMDELKKLGQVIDTSGKTESHITAFLEKYADGNDIIQVLRKDLMTVLSDMQWIVESNNGNEQWALDFADALNEISTAI